MDDREGWWERLREIRADGANDDDDDDIYVMTFNIPNLLSRIKIGYETVRM